MKIQVMTTEQELTETETGEADKQQQGGYQQGLQVIEARFGR